VRIRALAVYSHTYLKCNGTKQMRRRKNGIVVGRREARIGERRKEKRGDERRREEKRRGEGRGEDLVDSLYVFVLINILHEVYCRDRLRNLKVHTVSQRQSQK
jgi:hypothetical protein